MEKQDDAMTLRRRSATNSLSKIKELLQQISNKRCEDEEIQKKVEENERMIHELSKEVFALKEEYECEKQNLESKIRESEKHNSLLKSVKEDKENIDVSLMNLEGKHKALKKTKPSLKDQQILERGKRKHKLYKEFTGLRWDYSAPDNVLEGYITNKKDFLQSLSYKGDVDYRTLKELLWRDIHKSTLPSNSIMREESKENIQMNK